jgi:hypothetical protein
LTRGRLRGEASKEFRTIVDESISIPIERQEGIIGTGCGPRHSLRYPGALDIEIDALENISQTETIALKIY